MSPRTPAPGGAGESGPRRTIVKVCGLTRLEDAAIALECGADWLGFVVKGESPRLMEPERAAAIAAALPQAVTVAVMVAVNPDQALDLARRAGAGRVQLHLVDPTGWPEEFPLPAAFSVPVDREGRLYGPFPSERHLVLLDTAHPTHGDAARHPFPWDDVAKLAARRRVMLAGGLDAGNVATAMQLVRPFGVDASSRLESAPGIKDRDKVRRFVQAVRRQQARARG